MHALLSFSVSWQALRDIVTVVTHVERHAIKRHLFGSDDYYELLVHRQRTIQNYVWLNEIDIKILCLRKTTEQ